MKANSLAGLYRNPWIPTLCVFALFVVTRYMAAPFYELTIGYMWDGLLDTCVKPWQCATRQPIAGSDSCYLSYLTNYEVGQLFGYSVRHLQLFILTAAAVSMSLLFIAFRRIFGLPTAARTLALLLASLAFFTHGVLPTEMPSGLWGVSLALFILTWEPSWQRDLALAASCLVVIFCYGSGIVTVGPLILLHICFFKPRWPAPRLISFALFLSAVVLLAWWIRHAVVGLTDLTRWGVNRLEIPPIGKYLAGLKIVLTDIFSSGNSWYAGTYGKPYFNLLFSILLFVSLATLSYLLINRVLIARYFNRSGAGWQKTGRKTQIKLTDHERWQVIFLLTFCSALLVAGTNVASPGVRRIYTAVLLLVPIIAITPSLAWRQAWIPKLLNVVFAIALVCEAVSTSRLIRSMWPPPPAATWFIAAEKIANQIGNLEEPAIVVIDRDLEPALDRVFCRLYLDRATRAKAKEFYAIENSPQGKIVLSKNGAPFQPPPPPLDQGFVLVTRSQARADQLLPSLLAQTTPNAPLKKVLLVP